MRRLVWFRSDLRTRDNTALHAACEAARAEKPSGDVVGLFVISAAEWTAHDYAPARIDLMLRTLRVLSDDLAALNIPLLIAEAKRPADVPSLVAETARKHGCGVVHFNKEYEIDEARRDAATLGLLKKAGIEGHAHTDQVCFEPGEIRTGEGRYYTVFTPFKRAWAKRYEESGGVKVLPRPGKQAETRIERSRVPDRVKGFEPRSNELEKLWPAGEAFAIKRLGRFIEQSAEEYDGERNYPARDGTSRLSPYLAIGAISPRQCVIAAVEANKEIVGKKAKDGSGAHQILEGSPGLVTWIGELVWREFYVSIAAGFPRVCMARPFKPATERIRWSDNEVHFEAWKAGRTGVPIVDAGMRQLLAEGWMHNRVRMITAMYLSKNLLIDWRWGERWFMRNLVDGFFANNNGGWQWSASTGTDAAPYFRVFNPVSQGKKFDPDGEYVRKYVPELRGVPNAQIHEPWKVKKAAKPDSGYPKPLVDLSESRRRAIAAFRDLRTDR